MSTFFLQVDRSPNKFLQSLTTATHFGIELAMHFLGINTLLTLLFFVNLIVQTKSSMDLGINHARRRVIDDRSHSKGSFLLDTVRPNSPVLTPLVLEDKQAYKQVINCYSHSSVALLVLLGIASFALSMRESDNSLLAEPLFFTAVDLLFPRPCIRQDMQLDYRKN